MAIKKHYFIAMIFASLFIAALTAACGSDSVVEPTPVNNDIQLTSSAFAEGQCIPIEFTCDGANVSPPLRWSNIPNRAESIALIMDDPDAPSRTFVHWVIYNIPVDTGEMAAGAPPLEAQSGSNDFNITGYGGPCPPSGNPHRYFFKVFALDELLDLDTGSAKSDLLDSMDGHILAQGQLMGLYQRQ